MNQSALRLFVRSLITEAKEEKKENPTKLPKSSGKLMDLKKELTALEQYRDEIQTAKFAEKTADTEVQFADLAKFKRELDIIKEKGLKLEGDLEAKIEEIKAKIETQKNKIKEMMGVTPAPGQEEMIDEKKKPSAGMTKKEKSAVVKKAKSGGDIGKPGKGFEKVAKAAGGGEKGQKVAAAAMWKGQAKK